jgi:hypothetical protein
MLGDKRGALPELSGSSGFVTGRKYQCVVARVETATTATKINRGHTSGEDWARDGAGNDVLLGFEESAHYAV